MNKFLIISIVSLSVFAQSFSKSHIKKLESLKEIKPIDLVHEHVGCPENSGCSKSSAKLLNRWSEALKKYEKSNKVSYLNKFINKYGHPTVFLAKEDKTKSLDPIIFSSQCGFHRKEKIIRAQLFLKAKPKNENLVFNLVEFNKNELPIPYESRIIGFKNNRAIIIFSDNDVLYTISYGKNLKAVAINLSKGELSTLLEKKENINCKEKLSPDKYYKSYECYKVWDLNRKELTDVRQKWGCI